MSYKQALVMQCDGFTSMHQVLPLFGVEQEFYIGEVEEGVAAQILAQVMSRAQERGIAIHHITHEDGYRQYEIGLAPLPAVDMAQAVFWLREALDDACAQRGVSLLYYPERDMPPCSMQLHISLHDVDTGANLYAQDEALLQYSIGGLCAFVAQSMAVYASDSRRYDACGAQSHAHFVPSVIGYSANQRNTALRLPRARNPQRCRVENRLPAADADPFLSIALMLYSVNFGLQMRILPPPQIYGDGKGAAIIPQSLAQARLLHYEGGIIRQFLRKFYEL